MKQYFIPVIRALICKHFIPLFSILFFIACNSNENKLNGNAVFAIDIPAVPAPLPVTDTSLPVPLAYDTVQYNKLMKVLANGDKTGHWPPAASLPLDRAILPFNRVVAYYGNFYSRNMGILGEYDPPVMLQKLKEQAGKWAVADSLTPVIPALHYIAVTAQGSPGDGYYRLRMPEIQIQKAIRLADSIKGIVFLDVQVGKSTVENELPRLEKYMKLPNVHLGIDPEFSMKTGKTPGTVIGTMDAADINYATRWLAKIVKENQLPPKILVVHRFTAGMLTNYKKIETKPEVQIVINMDGFGAPVLKQSTYRSFIYREPVQFTGFKLFYKNDVNRGGRMMNPDEILALKPRPIYIQYQ